LAKILLDSDVLIEWLRGHEPIVHRIQTLVESYVQLFWTPVSIAEIIAGVRPGEEDDVRISSFLESISITPEVGRRSATSEVTREVMASNWAMPDRRAAVERSHVDAQSKALSHEGARISHS
jgi:predicted nucleic acid-binding protein